MGSWTLENVSGLTPVKRDSQLPGFHFTPLMSCSALALGSILNLLLPLFCILYWGFFSFFFFFFFYHLSLLGVLGPPFPLLWVLSFPRLFLLWLNTLHKPEAMVTLLVKNQERQETREEEGSTVSCQSWKAPFPQKARSTLPGPAPRRALPTSDLWAVKFQQGLGRGVASQRSDLATAGERRGTFVLGVSLILRWSPQCQKLWLKKKLKSGLTLKWVNFFFQLTNYTFHSNPKHVKIMVNLQQNHGESSAKVHSSWYDGQADWDIVYLRNLSISLWAFKYLGINTRVEPGCCTGLHKLLCKHSHTYSHTHTYSDTRNTHTPSPHRGTFCKLYIWFQRTNR